MKRWIQNRAGIDTGSSTAHPDQDGAMALAEIVREQAEREHAIARRNLNTAKVLPLGGQQILQHLGDSWIVNLADDHWNINRLDADNAIAIDAFDIDFFAGIVRLNDDRCRMIYFFDCQCDGNALVVRTRVNDDLGCFVHTGASHYIDASRLAS